MQYPSGTFAPWTHTEHPLVLLSSLTTTKPRAIQLRFYNDDDPTTESSVSAWNWRVWVARVRLVVPFFSTSKIFLVMSSPQRLHLFYVELGPNRIMGIDKWEVRGRVLPQEAHIGVCV